MEEHSASLIVAFGLTSPAGVKAATCCHCNGLAAQAIGRACAGQCLLHAVAVVKPVPSA